MEDEYATEHTGHEQTRGLVIWAVQAAVFVSIFAACLFIPAGRLDWVMGWLYIGLLATSQIVTALALIPSHPELLTERAQSRGPRDLDRILAGVMALWGPALTLIVAGLDMRFGWSPAIAPGVQFGALVAAALASLLTIWAMASNRHFYGVFRIAEDRHHTVASRGPYQFVRHPGYLGAILFDLATPFALGSVWAVIPAVLTACAIIARTSLEDKGLQKELDGYQVYAQQVRHRLIPTIW